MTEISHELASNNDHYSPGTKKRYLESFTILAVFAIAIGFATYYAQDFTLDASSDTLLDQNDPQLQYYLSSRERFVGAEDFLVLTYTPNNDGIFTPATLGQIDRLQRRLEEITGVASVYSILDAPLLKSPPISLAEVENGFRTLRSSDVDLRQAQDELSNSPIFSDLIISTDSRTTALRIELMQDQQLLAARKRRDTLRQSSTTGRANDQEVSRAEADYRNVRDGYLERRSKLLAEVGAIRDEFGLEAETTSMRCVGYRQAWMYLDNEINLTEMREMGLAATRQLAKRQLTWLRSMKGFKEFNCFAENLLQLVLEYLQENGPKGAVSSKSRQRKHTG